MPIVIRVPVAALVAILAAVGVAMVLGGAAGLVYLGGPDLERECNGRAVNAEPLHAAEFEREWDRLDALLDAGEGGSFVADESMVSARARVFLGEEGVEEIGAVVVCFREERAEVFGTVDVPLIPDVTVRLEGTINLGGAVPVIDVMHSDLGSVPRWIAGLVDGAIEEAVNDAFGADRYRLEHRYEVRFEEGVAVIAGTP